MHYLCRQTQQAVGLGVKGSAADAQLVGIWAAAAWQAAGSPARVRLVELGPGRGTLMADLLRGTSGLRVFAAAVEVHLVEVPAQLQLSLWLSAFEHGHAQQSWASLLTSCWSPGKSAPAARR